MGKPKSGNRKLITIGGSIGVTLPKSHIERMGWKAGDKVGLVFDDILVIIRPVLAEEPKELKNIRAGEDDEGLRRIHS